MERQRRRAAQKRYEEEQDRVEVKEPTLVGRIWKKSSTSSSRQGVDPEVGLLEAPLVSFASVKPYTLG
jgi:hypothetical protein